LGIKPVRTVEEKITGKINSSFIYFRPGCILSSWQEKKGYEMPSTKKVAPCSGWDRLETESCLVQSVAI
jgi:hypothetical protein